MDWKRILRSAQMAQRDGNLDAAEALYNQAIVAAPEAAAARHLFGLLRMEQGRIHEAEELLRAACERTPHLPEALLHHALSLTKLGRLEEALAVLDQLLVLKPDAVGAWNNRAEVLVALGRLKEAEAYYRDLVVRVPDNTAINLNFSALLRRIGRYPEALRLVRAVVKRAPMLAKAHTLASTLACDLGHFEEGLARIDNAIALSPAETHLLIRRANILRQLGRSEEAVTACDQILSTHPDDPGALHVKALALRALHRPEEALALIQSVELSNPSQARVISDKAWLLAELGRKSEAIAALDTTIKAQPDFCHAWYRRFLLKRHEISDTEISYLEGLMQRDLPHHDRIYLSFALAKAYLELKDGDTAFRHLNCGNKLKRSAISYSHQAEVSRTTSIIERFNADFLAQKVTFSDHTQRPIFVFGMPRSGTTLIEQILASHALVGSISEAGYMDDIAAKMNIGANVMGTTSEAVMRDIPALRARYFALVRHRAAEPFVIDKMPTNFLNLGLIHFAFPEAVLIHCRRHPLDTCLSCYATLFTNGNEFSYDQQELGRYYRLYCTLMTHWRSALPAKRIYDLDYERVVCDNESEVRRVLDFCGLPWDPDCLRFYEANRHVATASLDQVRSPIYRTSLGRAEPFRAWLSALEDELGGMP